MSKNNKVENDAEIAKKREKLGRKVRHLKKNAYLCSRFRIGGNAEERPLNVKPRLKA